MTTSPGARLRAAMDSSCVAIPGAFNALCAKAVAKAGFAACYISGAATSVSAGVPDVGLLSLEHFCRQIREAADASGLPVLADADTGFGEAEMVRRTVIEYARAGAAGLHLEDQKFPKRCGHLDGKELVPLDHMVEKIQWAVKAARDLESGKAAKRQSGKVEADPAAAVVGVGPGFIVCARTDARAVEGFDAAVARARAYVEAGADMIFPEGLATEEEFGKFAAGVRGAVGGGGAAVKDGVGAQPARKVYLLANMTEFGKTPMIPLVRFAAMGYSCVIFPVSMLRVAMGAVTRALEVLKREGTVEPLLKEMQSRKDLYELVGYEPGVPWEVGV